MAGTLKHRPVWTYTSNIPALQKTSGSHNALENLIYIEDRPAFLHRTLNMNPDAISRRLLDKDPKVKSARLIYRGRQSILSRKEREHSYFPYLVAAAGQKGAGKFIQLASAGNCILAGGIWPIDARDAKPKIFGLYFDNHLGQLVLDGNLQGIGMSGFAWAMKDG